MFIKYYIMQRVCVYIYIWLYISLSTWWTNITVPSGPPVSRTKWLVCDQETGANARRIFPRAGSLCPPKKKGGVESLEILRNMYVNHWKYSTILLVELFQWFIANLKYSSNMYVKCTLYSIYSRHDDCNNSEVFNHPSLDQQANMLDTPLGDSQLAALGW